MQGRCLVIANLASMTQTQLLELSRGSFWHAQMLRLCGAHIERGVFLDSLGLMVCLFFFATNPLRSCCLLAVLGCSASVVHCVHANVKQCVLVLHMLLH